MKTPPDEQRLPSGGYEEYCMNLIEILGHKPGKDSIYQIYGGFCTSGQKLLGWLVGRISQQKHRQWKMGDSLDLYSDKR